MVLRVFLCPPLTSAVIVSAYLLVFVLIFIVTCQNQCFPHPPSDCFPLLTLFPTRDLWPASQALQASAAGTDVWLALLIFLHRICQHVCQILIGKKWSLGKCFTADYKMKSQIMTRNQRNWAETWVFFSQPSLENLRFDHWKLQQKNTGIFLCSSLWYCKILSSEPLHARTGCEREFNSLRD